MANFFSLRSGFTARATFSQCFVSVEVARNALPTQVDCQEGATARGVDHPAAVLMGFCASKVSIPEGRAASVQRGQRGDVITADIAKNLF
jgi:hypothetical protein